MIPVILHLFSFMAYFWVPGFRPLLTLIAAGSYIVCAATVTLALPPNLEKQVRSGNLTRQEAEQLARISGSTSSKTAPSSAPAAPVTLPTSPQEQPTQSKVDEKALLERAEKLMDDAHGDGRKLLEAKKYIEQVLTANPRNALAYVDLADLALDFGYINSEDYEPQALQMAHRVLDKAFKLDPSLYEAYSLAARIAYLEDDLPTARKLAATAVKIKPSEASVWVIYAKIANRENNPDEAIIQANKALIRKPNKGWKEAAYLQLINAYEAKKEYKQAERYYLATLAVDPSAWAKINYARFLGCGCDGRDPNSLEYDKAISYGESALKQMNFPMAHTVLGRIYFNRAVAHNDQGQKNLAVNDFKMSAQHYKANGDQKDYQLVLDRMKELNLGSF
jgi:tetratricopeptide (TPR) repeat protein